MSSTISTEAIKKKMKLECLLNRHMHTLMSAFNVLLQNVLAGRHKAQK